MYHDVNLYHCSNQTLKSLLNTVDLEKTQARRKRLLNRLKAASGFAVLDDIDIRYHDHALVDHFRDHRQHFLDLLRGVHGFDDHG